MSAFSAKPLRKCGRVHLTVSSLQETHLEMNWITDCNHPLDVVPDIIALYEKDPRERNVGTKNCIIFNKKDKNIANMGNFFFN